MLSIYGVPTSIQELGKGMILSPSSYFNLNYKDEWLDSDLCRKIITDINGTDVTDTDYSVRTLLALQGVHPEILCTGVKNLLNCLYCKENKKHRLAFMGENCFKWLVQISNLKDVSVVTGVAREFVEEDISGGKIYFPDVNMYAYNEEEFSKGMIALIGSGVMNDEYSV